MCAASDGHTDVVIALLAVPSIKVNHANVSSSSILTPSRVIVGGGGLGPFTTSTSSSLPLL